MKHSLTSLVFLVFAAPLALWVYGQANPPSAASKPAASLAALPSTPPLEPAPAVPPPVDSYQDGNKLMADAVRQVTMLTSIKAKVRMQANLLGHELSGTGNYSQLTLAPKTLYRLELKVPVANEISSLLLVSDGRFLWTRHDLPGSKRLERIDQQRVQEALLAKGRQSAPLIGGNILSFGGLGKTLDQISGHFSFDPPQATQWSGAPVWRANGKWRPTSLANLLPSQAATIAANKPVPRDKWPDQLPMRVVLLLSREPKHGLFPYRIEYQRDDEHGQPQAMLTLEFYYPDRIHAPEPREFDYKPGDQEVVDQTEMALKSWGL